MDEDCLYLNVWTPGTHDRALPVLVWLHGGAFVLGAGSTFLYTGRNLAARGDVVVVTANYRLGALGFLDLSQLSSDPEAPSNLGLLDQIAALRWVRENISAFGGDPDNVTLFGESAGAMCVGTHLALGGGLFRRAILQSGAAANIATAEVAAYVSERFLEALGLEAEDSKALRSLPTSRILAGQRAVLHSEIVRMGQLPWQPSLDGKILSRPPLAAIRDGSARDIAVLIGSNREEWKLLTAAALPMRAMDTDSLRNRVEQLLERGGREKAEAEELIRIYRASHPRGERATPYELWVAMRTDQVFRLPAIQLAEAHAESGGRTFMYRFDLEIPLLRRSLGACHAAELPLVFGSFEHPLLRPFYLNSSRARRLSRRMQDAWTGFARSGDLAVESTGHWPCYEPGERLTMILGKSCRVERAPNDEVRRFWLEQKADVSSGCSPAASSRPSS
jgi:para-nitrobenzyl esterase